MQVPVVLFTFALIVTSRAVVHMPTWLMPPFSSSVLAASSP